MASIDLTVNQTGYSTGYIVIAIYDTSAPATVVAYQSFAMPSQPGNITFGNLPNSTYRVMGYYNSTPTVGGALIINYITDKTTENMTPRNDMELVAGLSSGMTVGATSYSDATLAGWKYDVERRGFGTLKSDEVGYNPAGGFYLKNSGDTFGDQEIFILHFQPSVNIQAPGSTSSAGQLFSSTNVITATVTLDQTYMGSLNLIQGASSAITITLPASNTVTNNKLIAFISEGGSHKNAKLAFQGGDKLMYLSAALDYIYLCQGEQIWLFYDGSNWQVAQSSEGVKQVGELFYSAAIESSHPYKNCLLFNGEYGDTDQTFTNSNFTPLYYNRSDYPRLWDWIVNKLQSAQIVNEGTSSGQWGYVDNTAEVYPNKGKFSYGNGTTTFRLPRMLVLYQKNSLGTNLTVLAGGMYLRVVDPSNGSVRALDLLKDVIKPHDHTMHESGVIAPYSYYLARTGGRYAGGGVDGFGASSNPDESMRTGRGSLNGVIDNSNLKSMDIESRPFSIGMYLYIRY
jgi:hypothetical protein